MNEYNKTWQKKGFEIQNAETNAFQIKSERRKYKRPKNKKIVKR